MSGLAEVLTRNRVDATSLKPLYEVDGQTVWGLTTHGSKAIGVWSNLRNLSPNTSYWPVVLGDEETWNFQLKHLGISEEESSVQAILDKATGIEAKQWIEAENEENQAYMDPDEYEEYLQDLHQEWPGSSEQSHDFSTPYDFITKRPFPKVHMGLFPTENSWEVPAWLRYGGWNACPNSEVHVALSKYWHELYGAELVCATHDVLEFYVLRPPQTKEQAIALAEEQFTYCGDIVTQGVGTIEALAATLLGGTSWYFWWD